MSSQWKQNSNRRNAQHSTGPRTRRGKRRVSLNRSTHGIFCKRLVLPGENGRLFREIREQMIVVLRPQDVVEMMIVDRIVGATWKLRRLQDAEFMLHDVKVADMQEAVEDDEEISDEHREELLNCAQRQTIPAAATLSSYLNSDCGTADRLSRYEQRLNYTVHRAMRELREHRKSAEQTSKLPPSPFREAATFYDVDQRIKELDKMLRDAAQFVRNSNPRRFRQDGRAAAGENVDLVATAGRNGTLISERNTSKKAQI